MIITVPEREVAEVPTSAWIALAQDQRFWRLVDENILQPEAAATKHRLRGTCYVGRAVFGSTVIEVAEKFAGAFETLVSLGGLSTPKLTRTPSPVTPATGSTGILVSLCVRAARTYLSGSKRVAYVQIPDSGAMISGRLNVVRTARMRARGILHRAAFDRTVLTADVPINQCIYAALGEIGRLAAVAGVSRHDVASARALRLGLSECHDSVLGINRADLANLAARLSTERHAKTDVSDVISLAAAVLDAAGFGGMGEWSRSLNRSWFINLETFFEDAIRSTIARVLNDVAIVTRPQNRPPLFNRETGRYRANPDLVVRRKDGSVYAVGDAKYKDFTDWPSTSDVFEIIAHASAYGATAAWMFYPDENGFSHRSFGESATGCTLWAFGIDFKDFEGSVRRGIKMAAPDFIPETLQSLMPD